MRRVTTGEKVLPTPPPVTTAEAREEQMIALAFDLVQKRLIEGTATSQETTHFLKLATHKEQLEKMRLEKEIKLADAKIAAYNAAQHSDEVYEKALQAFKQYNGDFEEVYDEDIF